MPEPLSVDNFQGVVRRPQADKIPNGAHVIFKDVNLYDQSIKGNRGKLKQTLLSSSGLGKNGIFYYENAAGQKEIILCNSTTITNNFINPAATFFYSFTADFDSCTGGHSLAVDGTGNIYILENLSSTIRKYSIDGSSVSTFTIPDSFYGFSIAVSDDGEMWVGTQDSAGGLFRIYHLNSIGQSLGYIASTTLRYHMAYRQGFLYVDKDPDVEIYNSSTLALDSTVSGTAGDTIEDIAYSPDGNLYLIAYNATDGTMLKKVYGTTMSNVVTLGTTYDAEYTSMAVDEYERIWIHFPNEDKCMLVYDGDGTKLEEFFHKNVSDNTDPFYIYRGQVGCYTNSLIIHDYSTFKGVKVFVYQKW